MMKGLFDEVLKNAGTSRPIKDLIHNNTILAVRRKNLMSLNLKPAGLSNPDPSM